jgi:5-methylcytosine-specific restriction endonuclease McrA
VSFYGKEKDMKKGEKQTEEAKRKMSESHKGLPCSKETKQKMSIARRGEKNHNWKGGEVKITCKHCGKEKYIRAASVSASGNYCSQACHYEAVKGVKRGVSHRKTVNKICQTCGKDFEISAGAKYAGQKYCSKVCEGIGRRKQATMNCAYCGIKFEYRASVEDKKYCSRKCMQASAHREAENTCEICGQLFKAPAHRPDQKRCSPECYYKTREGVIVSPETLFKKGQYAGEKNKNWKGGITPLNKLVRSSGECLTWRRDVFKRDQWKCQKCDKGGRGMVAHHIKTFAEYPDLRFDVENGVTLCTPCHVSIHAEDKTQKRMAGLRLSAAVNQ